MSQKNLELSAAVDAGIAKVSSPDPNPNLNRTP